MRCLNCLELLKFYPMSPEEPVRWKHVNSNDVTNVEVTLHGRFYCNEIGYVNGWRLLNSTLGSVHDGKQFQGIIWHIVD